MKMTTMTVCSKLNLILKVSFRNFGSLETCSDETSDAPSTPPSEPKKGKKKDRCQQQQQQLKQIKDKPDDKKCKQQEPTKKVNRTEWFEQAMVLEKPGDPLRVAEVSLTRQVYGVNAMKKWEVEALGENDFFSLFIIIYYLYAHLKCGTL